MTACYLPGASPTQGLNPRYSLGPKPQMVAPWGSVPCLAPHNPYSCLLTPISAQKLGWTGESIPPVP